MGDVKNALLPQDLDRLIATARAPRVIDVRRRAAYDAAEEIIAEIEQCTASMADADESGKAVTEAYIAALNWVLYDVEFTEEASGSEGETADETAVSAEDSEDAAVASEPEEDGPEPVTLESAPNSGEESTLGVGPAPAM